MKSTESTPCRSSYSWMWALVSPEYQSEMLSVVSTSMWPPSRPSSSSMPVTSSVL